mmetsp:Transcript_90870/g.261848  ORF Transcript_90870/g.261848 Transcript_90870/m.261848 type:complete len:611 (+) Transcript_90870:73-1905(+)
MRQYEFGKWGVSFACDMRGSVIPKAMCWAVPSALLAGIMHYLIHTLYATELQDSGFVSTAVTAGEVWQNYNFLVGFLLTFRTGQAYSRWWEGGTLLQEARGEWFNAYSSLIAFTTTNPERREEVRDFHRLLATLMSLLYSSALYQVSQTDCITFAILDSARIDAQHLQFLQNSHDKVEIVMQWIQRLITLHMSDGILPMAPPVISRVFQELSRGVVNVNNVRKISEFLFPFPYAQLISIMLLVHFVLTPILTSVLLDTWWWAMLASFISVFALWSLNYVAAEIECPFGDDDNDLPMQALQKYMNRTLASLLDSEAQVVPVADTRFKMKFDRTQFSARPAWAAEGSKGRKNKRKFFGDDGIEGGVGQGEASIEFPSLASSSSELDQVLLVAAANAKAADFQGDLAMSNSETMGEGMSIGMSVGEEDEFHSPCKSSHRRRISCSDVPPPTPPDACASPRVAAARALNKKLTSSKSALFSAAGAMLDGGNNEDHAIFGETMSNRSPRKPSKLRSPSRPAAEPFNEALKAISCNVAEKGKSNPNTDLGNYSGVRRGSMDEREAQEAVPDEGNGPMQADTSSLGQMRPAGMTPHGSMGSARSSSLTNSEEFREFV